MMGCSKNILTETTCGSRCKLSFVLKGICNFDSSEISDLKGDVCHTVVRILKNKEHIKNTITTYLANLSIVFLENLFNMSAMLSSTPPNLLDAVRNMATAIETIKTDNAYNLAPKVLLSLIVL